MFTSDVHLARLELVNPLSMLLLNALFILLAILAKLGEVVAPESRVHVGELVCVLANLSALCGTRLMHLCVQQHPGVLVSELLWV